MAYFASLLIGVHKGLKIPIDIRTGIADGQAVQVSSICLGVGQP